MPPAIQDEVSFSRTESASTGRGRLSRMKSASPARRRLLQDKLASPRQSQLLQGEVGFSRMNKAPRPQGGFIQPEVSTPGGTPQDRQARRAGMSLPIRSFRRGVAPSGPRALPWAEEGRPVGPQTNSGWGKGQRPGLPQPRATPWVRGAWPQAAVAPSGLMRSWKPRPPGAHAPGYMPLPLAGQKPKIGARGV
jgi:hypothetical protein